MSQAFPRPRPCLSRLACLLVASLAVCLALLAPRPSEAQGTRVVRDAEIETFLEEVARPIFAAAGLGADAVDLVLVINPSVNAFVSGGANLFLNTGLVLRADSIEELSGVIAHETGHIVGGHLIRGRDAIAASTAKSLLGMLVGLGAAALSDNPDVANAAIASARVFATADVLQYSRAQESAADQSAVSILDAAGLSARGLPSFFAKLAERDYLANSNRYWRSHPLSQDRIDQLKSNVVNAYNFRRSVSFDQALRFERVKAKLAGFLLSATEVDRLYPPNNTSVPAIYARATYAVRNAPLEQALGLIDQLIAHAPQDPYFHELRGQALREHGHIQAALVSYNQALQLAGEQPVLLASAAQVYLDEGSFNALAQGLGLLNRALLKEPSNASYWRMMAIGYAKGGEQGLSALAMAESGLALGDEKQAIVQAKRAQDLLTANSPSWLRAKDIEYQAELK